MHPMPSLPRLKTLHAYARFIEQMNVALRAATTGTDQAIPAIRFGGEWQHLQHVRHMREVYGVSGETSPR